MSEQGQPEKEMLDKPESFDHKPYRDFYELAGGAVAVLIVLFIGVAIFSTETLGYWQNIYATAVGTILAVLVLDRQAEKRSKRERVEEAEAAEARAIKQRKEELILQMGSPDNGFAVEAVRLLSQRGWLKDGSLISANLQKANLQKADLVEAKLKGADLSFANLQEASLIAAELQLAELFGTNLEGANLSYANLQKAGLFETNLEGANLSHANLQMAGLIHANLQEADLSGADLQEAELTEANLDLKTILPDGSLWTPDRDMRDFTDPNHPKFWRSNDLHNTAYHGLKIWYPDTEQPGQG